MRRVAPFIAAFALLFPMLAMAADATGDQVGRDARVTKESRTRTITATNAEDAEAGIRAAMADMFGETDGGVRVEDKTREISTWGMIVVGGILILGGLAAAQTPLISGKAGAILVGIGIAMMAGAFWIPQAVTLILVLVVVALVVGFGWYAYKSNWFDRETSDQVMNRLLREDDDMRAAGAVAHIAARAPGLAKADATNAAKLVQAVKMTTHADKAGVVK